MTLDAAQQTVRDTATLIESKLGQIRILVGAGPTVESIPTNLRRAASTSVMNSPLHIAQIAPATAQPWSKSSPRGPAPSAVPPPSSWRPRQRPHERITMSNEIVHLAKKINAGESGNYRSKAEWYRVVKALAEEQRQAGESSEQAFARYVTATEDGKALFGAYKSAGGPDFQPTPVPVLVMKAESAHAKLRKIAADLRAEKPRTYRGRSVCRSIQRKP